MKARRTRAGGKKSGRAAARRSQGGRTPKRSRAVGRGARGKASAAGRVKAAGGRGRRAAPGKGRVVSGREAKAGAGAGAAGVKRPVRRVKFTSPRMQSLSTMLTRKGAEILEQIKRAREATADTDRTSFAEVGDLVSASVEKEKAFEYGEAGVNALREIRSALRKLKEGTYGLCELCGKPIGLKRLEVMPYARLCVKCKAKEESSGKTVPPSADNLFED